MSLTYAAACRQVDNAYMNTHTKLANNDEYQRLAAAAQEEENVGSPTFLARNQFTFFIELNTPLFP